MSMATKSSGCRSGRTSAIASSPSSATAEIATVFELICAEVPPMSVDHHHAALHHRHGAAAHLCHCSLELTLDLRLDLDHHTLDRHSHLIDLDAALTHLKLDGLHRLRFDLAEIDLVRLVAHLNRRGLVSHIHRGALVALLDRGGLVARVDLDCL